MARAAVAAALLWAVAAAVLCSAAKDAPTFPKQYLFEGTFSLPYFNITEPIRVVTDWTTQKQRIDYYYGMDSFIYTPSGTFEVVPAVDRRVCMVSNSSDLTRFIPDLTTGWTYAGVASVRGFACDHWTQSVDNLGRTSVYDFYALENLPIPLQLVMNGYDFVLGSHPDIYILDFEIFNAGYANPMEFVPSKLCAHPYSDSGLSARMSHAMLRRLLPRGDMMSELFAAHVDKHGKRYASRDEHEQRLAIFTENHRFIEHYNRHVSARTGLTLAMNQFGDVSDAEWRESVLPRKGLMNRPHVAARMHARSPAGAPSSIDWRALGAVTMVKDQAACGSCWSFGTTGSLEGVNFVTNGQLVSVSEQQLVDCAWGAQYGGSKGCDGGFCAGAFQWIMDNGGIATELSYRYLGQDSFCQAQNRDSGIKVTGYVNVTEGSEADLMDAVGTVGPVSIGIDAAHKEFEFYSSGVYYNPDCKTDVDDLDHAVLAVGYGTSVDGQDYWIVKNSWSTHWGDNGYVLMARNRGNNCGIATQAVYPIVART